MNFLKYILFYFTFLSTIQTVNANLLDVIKDRGHLKCGISEPRVGFADLNEESKWIGFDVDMCKAVSAAIFSNTENVEFIITTNRSRFPALASKEIDILSRITTWTFSRDVNLSFEFVGINFYDGLGFLVNSDLEIQIPKDLNGSNVCLQEGSSTSFYIDEFFKKNNIVYNSIPVELDDEGFENFLSGRCDVYTNYITELANKRINLANLDKYEILPFLLSREPLGPLVRHGDDQWKDLVSWTLKVMILAEELNINSKNIDSFEKSKNNEILRLLGHVGSYGDMVELDEKWAYNIIKLVGNYKEVFDRNLGSKTLLGLNRGLNSLYIDGGLLYVPPFR